MDVIYSAVKWLSDILYQPWFVPLLLLAGGIYFSVRCRFIQLTKFKEGCRVIMEKPKNKEGISSFGALMVSTASRVGTGNIIGVSSAICLGGPGALFWMWITAILGASSAFVESTLAQIYKRKNPDGSSYGGPAFYMETALKKRWLGVIFSALIILTYAVGYNMLASYNLQSAFAAFQFYDADVTPYIIGLILMVLFGIIILSGSNREIKLASVMVPVMGVLYVLIAVIVMIMNRKHLPAMFGSIFSNAFDFKAVLGGFSGSCIMHGIRRGLYSNEAGMGSAPNASAKADVSHPAKQGMVQMISVFIDTLLICTATSFMCMSSGITPAPELAGAAYVQQSMYASLGSIGPIFIAVALSLFAFTTLVGNYSYCESCLEFILHRKPGKKMILVFRLASTVLIFVGAIANAGFVWDTSDLFQALMVVINMPTILILSNIAFRCLKDYNKQRKEGREPQFKAKDIGLQEETDFWK